MTILSTELSTSRADLPMVESNALRLAFQLADVREALMHYLTARLSARGHAGVTASSLAFLGQLDCGVNHAAEVARRVGVSRQMIGKTVAELEQAGWLQVGRDPEHGNRKIIRFTAAGERLMSDARGALAELDTELDRACGTGFCGELVERLERIEAVLQQPL